MKLLLSPACMIANSHFCSLSFSPTLYFLLLFIFEPRSQIYLYVGIENREIMPEEKHVFFKEA